MAATADLIRDPLFQQNVVLWLAQEGPPSDASDGDIEPVHYAQGFGVLAIERRLTLPAPVNSALAATSIECNGSALPDVLLLREEEEEIHGGDLLLLVVECKRSSFGTSSSTARQARTIMLACGSDAASTVGVGTLAGTLLGYLVPDDQETLMSVTLSELTDDLCFKYVDPGSGR